jgi:hypothetical protein
MLNDDGEPTGSGCDKCRKDEQLDATFLDHWDKAAAEFLEEDPELQK